MRRIWGSVGIAVIVSLCGQFSEPSQRSDELLKRAADADRPVSERLAEFWLDDDTWNLEVNSIITPEEIEAYRGLKTVGQRSAFIAQFWARRDPTPGTSVNEYQNEYEQRIQYSSRNFAEPDSPGTPGFQTARGRLYVLLGPPDEVQRPTGGPPPATEVWRYRDQPRAGEDFVVQFALSGVMSCDYAFRILSPSPASVFEAVATSKPRLLGESPVSIRTYGRGFVSMLIPMDLRSAVGVRWELRGGDGGVVGSGQLGFTAEEEIRKSGETRALAEHLVVPPFDAAGFACTKLLPRGSYRLSSAVGYLGGRVHREEVAFKVE